MGNRAGIADFHAQESTRYAVDTRVHCLALFVIEHHVHHQLHACATTARRERLDRTVCVGDGGWLGRTCNQNRVRRCSECHRVGADACTRVDDEHIHRLLEVHQLLEHIASLNLSHVGQSRNTRGAGEQAKSAWRSHHHFIEGAFARDHIFERRSRRDAAQHVSVGKAKICVKQNGAQSAPCEIHREIDREIGLAHTALTAGDRDCAR